MSRKRDNRREPPLSSVEVEQLQWLMRKATQRVGRYLELQNGGVTRDLPSDRREASRVLHARRLVLQRLRREMRVLFSHLPAHEHEKLP